MPAKINIIGRKFTRLTVIGEAKSRYYPYGKPRRRSFARCDCGKIGEFENCNLTSGHTQSCGCLHREVMLEAKTTHGHTVGTPTRTYSTWRSIIERCTNPKNNRWQHYGGRGIKICQRWVQFENFLTDMGIRPKGKTIERIDNDGDYCAGNCKWATRQEQQRNKRTNHMVTFQGITCCLTEMCERFSISRDMVRARINAYGWSVDDAFTKPKRST